MKRAPVHGFFAATTVGLAALMSWQAYTLYEHKQTVSAVAEVPSSLNAQTTDDVHTTHPEALLAKASALSAGGQFEAAETLFVKLIDQHQFLPLGKAARFNLANHYLREGMRQDLAGAQTRALLATAKQRYRDLLQADPFDWDARHNLELALRLAPEEPEGKRIVGPPPKRVEVIVPDFVPKDLP